MASDRLPQPSNCLPLARIAFRSRQTAFRWRRIAYRSRQTAFRWRQITFRNRQTAFRERRIVSRARQIVNFIYRAIDNMFLEIRCSR